MGDEAEGVFEQVYGQGFVRTGLNRPPLMMSMLPEFVRYTPDYLTSKGYVEVQGFGRDQINKFKREKIEALLAWNRHFRVDFFLWDSYNKRYGWVRLQDLVRDFRPHHVQTFPEGKEYFGVSAAELPMAADWVKLQ
jgi:hypothetical protein